MSTIQIARGNTEQYIIEARVGDVLESLDGGLVLFTVRDAPDLGGTLMFQKSSADPTQILHLDQLDPATVGKARLYLEQGDTEGLVLGKVYYYSTRATVFGGQSREGQRGNFIVTSRLGDLS